MHSYDTTAPGHLPSHTRGRAVFREVDNSNYLLELETKVKQRFAKVSIVSYSRQSLMIIALAS